MTTDKPSAGELADRIESGALDLSRVWSIKAELLAALRSPPPVAGAEVGVRTAIELMQDIAGSDPKGRYGRQAREAIAALTPVAERGGGSREKPKPCPQESHDHCVWPRCDCVSSTPIPETGGSK